MAFTDKKKFCITIRLLSQILPQEPALPTWWTMDHTAPAALHLLPLSLTGKDGHSSDEMHLVGRSHQRLATLQ